MVGKKEYIQYFRMIPYIQPGDIRDAVEKESKKFKTPLQSSSNISPSIQSQSIADIQRQIAKSQSVSNQAKVKEFQTQIEWYRVQQKEAIERTAQLKSEMKRTDIEAIKTKAKMQSNLKTQETLEQERRKQSGAESAIYRERGVQLERTKGVSARRAEAEKYKELNKYNGMSLPGIANKLLSEKIQTSLTQGLGKIFTGSEGKALTSPLGKSIIAGVSTAASGAIIAAVAAGAAALVALMILPFKIILSFSQKAFNFLKGIATQTETFKKLMELVMMPFMLMFTLLFAPVLMALAPLLATVIQTIASKQDAIMAVGAKIGLVIEKLFDDKMIETYITLIDQVIGAIDWFVDIVKDNLTIGNSIFETIVLTFTKVMSAVLVEITRWAYGPEGTGVIKELGTLIGTMIGITAAFVISLLPAIFSALEPSIKGVFEGVMQFISDLFIAGIIDTLGIDSGLVAIIKNVFSIIGKAIGEVALLLASPVLGFANIKDTIADIGKSFDDLMGSITNYNSDNRVSNVDNTHFNFDISAGAGAGNLIDALTASLKLNGVI